MSSALKLDNNEEMTVTEAAEYLGWAESTLRKKIQNGQAPRRMKCGWRIKFIKSDLDAYLREITKIIPAFKK